MDDIKSSLNKAITMMGNIYKKVESVDNRVYKLEKNLSSLESKVSII